jgi:DNA-binding NarL/FixJ family response regulator
MPARPARSPLASPVADAAACDRYDCGHVARHADAAMRQAGILFRVVTRTGRPLPESTPAPVVAAVALMRQGVACREVAARYRDPINGRHVAAAPRTEPTYRLTPGQAEVLTLLATGITPEQASSFCGGPLHLSADTIISHRRNAIKAMGAHSLADAVAEAVARDLIAI